MKINEDSIKNVLTAMTNSIGKENVELYKKLIEGSGFKKITDVEEFFYALVYPHKNFLKGLIDYEISKNDSVKFIYLNNNFVENNFVKIIQDVEGSACSSDKSRTIVKRLCNWFINGERIEWDYSGEYTFHLPKKVFTTHDEIIEFYKGLENLYYGNYKSYLEALKKTLANAERITAKEAAIKQYQDNCKHDKGVVTNTVGSGSKCAICGKVLF